MSEKRSRGRSTPLSESRESPGKGGELTPLTPSTAFSDTGQTPRSIAVGNPQGPLAQSVRELDSLAMANPLGMLDNTPTTEGLPTPSPPVDDAWMKLWSLFPDLSESFISPELQIPDGSLPVLNPSTLPDTFAVPEGVKHDEPPGLLSAAPAPLSARRVSAEAYNDLVEYTTVFDFPSFGQSSLSNTTQSGAADIPLVEGLVRDENDQETQVNDASNLDAEAIMQQIFASSYGTNPM